MLFLRRMAFYAVARGHNVGIYDTWAACEKQVKGFKNARYKKFNVRSDAEMFIMENGENSGSGVNFANEAASTVNTTNFDKIVVNKTTTKDDFWPESDGDSFVDDAPSDADLLSAVYEIEGLPQPTTSQTSGLKRKAPTAELNGNAKMPKINSKVLKEKGLVHIGQYDFPVDDQGYVIAYTDGSCVNNGRANAIAGFGVYFSKNHPLNASMPVIGRVTNNAGEIQAAIHALRIAKDVGIERICICTDSQFLINAASFWITAWKRKNWRLKDGQPVKNIDDFKVLDLLLQNPRVFVKWNYVKGHANIEGNEMADQLARDGAAKYACLHLKKNRK